MGKESKGKLSKKSTPSKKYSERDSVPTPQSVRNVNFEGSEYTAVPLSETEDPIAESGGRGAPPPSKSKQSKRKDKKVSKKSSKRRARNDSDDDSIALERKPSPVIAPLPSLTREEYDFFEMVSGGDTEEVATFLQSDSFKDMDINKLNKSGFTILHIAVLRNDEDMVRLLLQQPDIRIYDTLLYAVREENLEIAKLLLVEYDREANEEQRQTLMKSAMTITQDPSQQETLSKMVASSMATVSPVVSPISTRSGVKSSFKLSSSNQTAGGRVSKKSKLKASYKSRSFYEPKTNIPTTSVSRLQNLADDNDEIPFDSEFSPVLTPLMLAAQQGSYPLIELFYSRNERLETDEFPHDIGCSCDICAKIEGEQDMTRAYQRHNLFKALTNPHYMCFLGRTEHKDPVNYALKKIAKLREIIKVDHAFLRLFDGLVDKLEDFITKMLELCRSTTETEIFLSPKDSNERLPLLYPRLWYTVGHDHKKFVASPNAQNIVYNMWTDGWPEWPTLNRIQSVLQGGMRILLWPIIGIFLCPCRSFEFAAPFKAPVSRFLMYIGSYLCFMGVVGIQALYPFQRCNDEQPTHQIDDDHCTQRGPPNIGSEPFLVIYILSFYLSIVNRQNVSWYWRMRWNWAEIIDQLLFTATFGCWGYAYYWTRQDENKEILKSTPRVMWPEGCAEIFGECFLSMAFLMAFARTLQWVIVIPQCGKIQIGIGHQVVDFVKGLLIMSVVIIAFGSGLMGLYMPYENATGIDPDDLIPFEKPQDDSFLSVVNTFTTLFWINQGKKEVSSTQLLTYKVVDNFTGEIEELHHGVNEWTGRLLFLGYHLIGSLMLGNMLAGYFSQTMTQIEENLDMYWKYARTELYLMIVKDAVAPPPLNIIPSCEKFMNGYDWLCHLCNKEDPKASCSLRHCCFVTDNEKTKNWKALMKGYRKLILQLIFRYMSSHEDAKGEEAVTKDDVLEIAEELAEINAMLKKASKNLGSSQEDDDDDPVGFTTSTKPGLTKTRTMVNSKGQTYTSGAPSGDMSGGPSGDPGADMSGGPSGAPSGGMSRGPSGAPSGDMSRGPSGDPSGDMSRGPSGAPSGGMSRGPSGAPSGDMSRGPSGDPSGDMSRGPSGAPSGDMSRGPSGAPSRNMSGGHSGAPSRNMSGGQSGAPSRNMSGGQSGAPSRNMSGVPSGNTGGGKSQMNANEKVNVTGNPSKSSNTSSGPTSIHSQVTPRKPTDIIDLFTGTTPPFLVSQHNPEPVSSSRGKSTNPFLDSSTEIEIKPSTGTLSNNNQKTMLNAYGYSQPRGGSRSGGGLEHSPEMGDFFGPAEINDPYKSPSKSTNNFYSIPEMEAASTRSPILQDFTRTTTTSKANNFNTDAITKDPFFKSIQILKNTLHDKPYGGVPPEITTVNSNDYAQPGSLPKSTNNFYSIVEMGATPKKSPVLQDFTRTTPASKANKLVDVWPSTTTLASSTRDRDLGAPTSPMSAGTKLKLEDTSPKLMDVKFEYSKRPQKDDNQNSPSRNPSLVPPPATKAPTTLAKPYISSDNSGNTADGSS